MKKIIFSGAFIIVIAIYATSSYRLEDWGAINDIRTIPDINSAVYVDGHYKYYVFNFLEKEFLLASGGYPEAMLQEVKLLKVYPFFLLFSKGGPIILDPEYELSRFLNPAPHQEEIINAFIVEIDELHRRQDNLP